MGVKTSLTLTQAQKLFPSFHITALQATEDGVMDTTYIAEAKDGEYIIKKYERAITHKIEFDTKLLDTLSRKGLNVPKLLVQNGEWYLYPKLRGESPKSITLAHMQKLGRFIARMHQVTQKFQTTPHFFTNYPLTQMLREHKAAHFYYYKKLCSLADEALLVDGFIHGDIFRDNTLFTNTKLSMFDFIDGGTGSFAFELGVVEISFNPANRKSFSQMLLHSYNQHAPKKLTLQELEENRKKAARLYALLRLHRHQKSKRAKELVKLC